MKAINLTVTLLLMINISFAQYWEGDNWYSNPLGFEPVKLHTSMGFIIPAVAVGTCLLLTKKDTSLHNKLSYYNETGLSWGYKYPHTFLPQVNSGINFQIRKFMSIGTEIDFYFPQDKYNNTVGVAVRPFARFYAMNNPSFKLYFESGGGLVYFFNEFPRPTDKDERLGTKLNGTTKYGIGAEIKVYNQLDLLAGLRHLHISNGNTKGVERNPSHDSNGIFVGLSYRLRK